MVIITLQISHSVNSALYLASGNDEHEFAEISGSYGLVTPLRSDSPSFHLLSAINEMHSRIPEGSSIKNMIAHGIINPDPSSPELTFEQRLKSWKTYECHQGLEGCSYIEFTHVQNSRKHFHRMYLRIDEAGQAITMSHTHKKNELIARILEHDFGQKITIGKHNKYVIHKLEEMGRQDVAQWMRSHQAAEVELPESSMTDGEYQQAKKSKVSIKEVSDYLTTAWKTSDSGQAFAAAIGEKGYVLAKGRDNGYVVLDEQNKPHSLRRRLKLDVKGKALTSELDKRLSGLNLEDVEIMKERRKKAAEEPQLTSETLKAEKERLQKWNYKLKSVEKELAEKEYSQNYREDQILDREQRITSDEMNLAEREKALQAKEWNLTAASKKLAEDRRDVSKLKSALQEKAKATPQPEPKKEQPTTSGSAAEFKQIMAEHRGRRENKSLVAEKTAMLEKFGQLREALADKSDKKMDALVKEARGEEFKDNVHDLTKNHQPSKSQPKKPVQLSDFVPNLKRKKDFASLKFREAWASQGFEAEYSKFKKDSHAMLNSYEDTVAKEVKDAIEQKIAEYNMRLRKGSGPIRQRYSRARDRLLAEQNTSYQQFIKSQERLTSKAVRGVLGLIGFGKLEKRIQKINRKFDRQQKQLHKVYAKEIAARRAKLEKSLRAEIKKIRENARLQLLQKPLLNIEAKQARLQMKMQFSEKQEAKRQSLERKYKDIPKVAQESPVISTSERTRAKLSEMAKNVEKTFKPANDTPEQRQARVIEILRSNNTKTQDQEPENRPHMTRH